MKINYKQVFFLLKNVSTEKYLMTSEPKGIPFCIEKKTEGNSVIRIENKIGLEYVRIPNPANPTLHCSGNISDFASEYLYINVIYIYKSINTCE